MSNYPAPVPDAIAVKRGNRADLALPFTPFLGTEITRENHLHIHR